MAHKHPAYFETSGKSVITFAIEVTHEGLPQPFRAVNDTVDLHSNGKVFLAAPIEIIPPGDKDSELSTAKLSVDNVSRELTAWLEQTNGGKGARCRFLQVDTAEPDDYLMDITLDLSDISIDALKLKATLGYSNSFALPAVTINYTPLTAPTLFYNV